MVDGGILLFWDDQIFEISKKYYGTRLKIPILTPAPDHPLLV